MKNKLIATALAAAAVLLAVPTAEARGYRGAPAPQHASHVYISGYHRCGTPIYTERYVVGYDRRHRPVFDYRVIHHRPRHVRPAPRGYYAPPCPPPVHRSRGHVTIRF